MGRGSSKASNGGGGWTSGTKVDFNQIQRLPLGSKIRVQKFKGGISKYKPTEEYEEYTLKETKYAGDRNATQICKESVVLLRIT